MDDVFLSYSRKDIEFVRRLHEALGKHKLHVWIDLESILPMEEWLKKIRAGIEGANNFIFVISPNSITSEICVKEVAHAIENHKRLMPILYREVEDKALAPTLMSINWIDFREPNNFDAAFNLLLKAININPDWVNTHTRLQVRAIEWNDRKHNESYLLRGVDLQNAVQWLSQAGSEKEQQPTSLQTQYIQASQEWEAQEIQRLRALYEKALARQLAAQAELIRHQQPSFLERSILLAVESIDRSPSLEAYQTLREGLALLPRCITQVKHKDRVDKVALSPDGQYLATASWDKTARVWDARNGQEIIHINHDGAVWAVAFSPDGRYLATGSGDSYSDNPSCVAQVWEISSKQKIAHFPHKEAVRAIAYSSDGRYLATGSQDDVARIWEIQSGQEISRISHNSIISSVSFSPDGKYLATGSFSDNTARVWEIDGGREVGRFEHSEAESVKAIAFSCDGQFLASAGGYQIARMNVNIARIWEINSGKEIARFVSKDNIEAVAFSPDGQYLATGSGDNTARVWDIHSEQEILRLPHSNSVTDVVFSSDGQYIATGSEDKTARVWESRSSRELAYFIEEQGVAPKSILKVIYSPDGQHVATWSYVLCVREMRTGRVVVQIEHNDAISSAAYSLDGKYLLTVGRDNTARLWDVNSWHEVKRLSDDAPISAVAFSLNDKYIAIGDMYETTRILEFNSGQEVIRLQTGILDWVSFSPCGQYLATASRDNTVRLWEIKSGQAIRSFLCDDLVWSAVFSPGGEYLATGSEDKTARLWDVKSGREMIRLSHDDAVLSVAFSPDGKHLATAGRDDVARIWEVSNGQEVMRLRHEGFVYSVAYSPDGRYLATAGTVNSEGITRVWFLRQEDLINEASSYLTRNLSKEEWSIHLPDESYRKTCANLP